GRRPGVGRRLSGGVPGAGAQGRYPATTRSTGAVAAHGRAARGPKAADAVDAPPGPRTYRGTPAGTVTSRPGRAARLAAGAGRRAAPLAPEIGHGPDPVRVTGAQPGGWGPAPRGSGGDVAQPPGARARSAAPAPGPPRPDRLGVGPDDGPERGSGCAPAGCFTVHHDTSRHHR